MATQNIQDYLGVFPKDCSSQQLYFDNLKQYLRDLENLVDVNQIQNIFVCQSTEPTQADWELAWVEQTGFTLPIPPSAELFWLSQDCSTALGVYGTIEGSSVVEPRIGQKPSGTSLLLFGSTDVSAGLSFGDQIGVNKSFETTISVPIKSTLVLSCFTWGGITVGPAGPFGIDFFLDGLRVGVEYYGIDPADGLSRMFDGSAAGTPGSLGAVALVPNVSAGLHTFAVTGGKVNTATSGTYAYDAVSVLVRGYAE